MCYRLGYFHSDSIDQLQKWQFVICNSLYGIIYGGKNLSNTCYFAECAAMVVTSAKALATGFGLFYDYYTLAVTIISALGI